VISFQKFGDNGRDGFLQGLGLSKIGRRQGAYKILERMPLQPDARMWNDLLEK
jgi:hypothetical protein